MESVDGDVRLSVSLDVKDVQKDANDLKKTMTNIFNQAGQKEQTAQFEKLRASMKQTAKTADTIMAKMKDLANTKIPTEDYAALQRQAEQTQASLNKMVERQQQMEDLGTKKTSSAWKRLQAQIEEARAALLDYRTEMQGMEETGTAFTGGADTAEYQKLEAALDAVNDKQRILIQRYDEAAEKTPVSPQAEGIIKRVTRALSGLISKMLQFTGSVLKQTASGIVNLTKKLAQLVSGGIKKAIEGFKNLKDKISGAGDPFKHGLKNVLRYGLGIRSLFVLFNKVRNAIKEALGTLAEQDSETANSMAELQASVGALKNSFGSLAAPILNMLQPALTGLIDLLTSVIDKLAQFFAMIQGKSTYQKAIKNKQAFDKTMGDTKGTDKSLASFDTINKLSANSGGGGGAEEAVKAFEEAKIDLESFDFIGKLKEAIENGDWTGVGELIAQKLNGALGSINLSGLTDKIKSAFSGIGQAINGFFSVKDLASTIGQDVGEIVNLFTTGFNTLFRTINFESIGSWIATGLNTMIQTIDWAAIGEMFARKFNAIFSTIYGFATTFDWKGFGKALVTGINTWIETFDWETAGASLSTLAKGLLDTLIELVSGVNWYLLGKKIETLMGSIDWAGIVSKIAELFGAALGGLTALLWGAIENAVKGIGNYFLQKFKEFGWTEDGTLLENGKAIIAGLFAGIVEALKNVGKWIKDNIFDPFIKGFKEAFKIHSPSKEMETMGDYVMEGLLLGITEKWQAIKTFFSGVTSWIKNTLSKNWKNAWGKLQSGIKTVFESMSTVIKTPINAIFTLINKLIKGASDGVNKVIEFFNSFSPPEWIQDLTGFKGINIPYVKPYQIPLLAQGAVLPPNNPFMAIVGDQKSGTNIEAPLDTIVEAFQQVQGNEKIVVEFKGSMSELIRILKPEIAKESTRVGKVLVV